MGMGGVVARSAAFIFGLLGSAVVLHAFGYRVANPPPPRETATVAREGAQKNPERHRRRIQEAVRRRARAADWSGR
jgi:hypothetical protein